MTALTYTTGFGTPSDIQVNDAEMETMIDNPLGFALGTPIEKKLVIGT